MTVAIGIDIGHDSVRVAALIEDRPVFVGQFPAVVGFDGDAVRVGDAARALPARQRLVPRAWLGRAYTALADTVLGPAGLAHPVVDGRSRSPVELLAWLIRAAVSQVEAAHGSVAGAVIAAASSDGAVERRALRDAAAMAGVPARLVAAPVAGLLALPTVGDGHWLVCDLGAHALTATVIEVESGAVLPLATAFDRDTGGDAIDRALADALTAQLSGLAAEARVYLVAAARALKEHAAEGPAAEAAFAAALAPLPGSGELHPPRRDELELWAAPLVRRADDVCARVLAAAGLSGDDLTEVVVVGAGRLPTLMRRIAHAVGRPPRVAAEADVAVARGAARLARLFVDEPVALVLDVVPHGLRLGTTALTPLVDAGAVAPTHDSRALVTSADDQASIEIELWEAADPPRPFGRYRVDGLPAAPAGEAVALCSVVVDVDLIPRVRAVELISGADLEVTALAEAGLDAASIAAGHALVAPWRP